MNEFAELLDRLAYEPRRNAKLRLLQDYFARTPDPERGYALAAMTGTLSFREAKPALIRGLVEARIDPVLFRLSHNYVGDLAETTALIWPGPVADAAPAPSSEREGGAVGAPGPGHNNPPPHVPTLAEVVETLSTIRKADLPGHLATWLDALDETGRWALLKLVTGNLRVGVSARLTKTAVGALGGHEADAVEEVWHGLRAPFETLFAWAEGRGPRPETLNPAPFRPPMLSHPIEEETDFDKLAPADFSGEWKWDGIRVQLVGGRDAAGEPVARIYSRTGEDISGAFPDLAEAVTFTGTLDGELLILREGRVQSFNVLQQRLNRKAVTGKLMEEFPAHVRAYDLLTADGEDLRALGFLERRARLEAFVATLDHARIDVSPLVPFATWDDLAAARADPAAVGAGDDADAIEGVMLKRRDSPYLPGRPKGPWWKWKREPHLVDAVMMYAQRGHGKRSSFYSDYTFGVWRDGAGGPELVPVGKAYHGFTDAELAKLDRYVRNHTVKRFGPVREVGYGMEGGLVLEIAFEGVQRSTRHKSGVAMRFPRVSRIRWDKPAAEADRIDLLERILARGERETMPGTTLETTE
ncbi:cisplatin damage response ATP-dependent DNA ligase [Methylobacterium sp. WL30]|uniref:cisplatin damage response ATP-dependent DNA ligase n=1 Tax=unclassified Methylobacterium TaxID=2615210 RepID=UPI0011CA00FC|nr:MULTISPECIES: cisplatin damage response ATP-dependent DNA ligase [unclassified Methylobacterium]TXM93374.1 cisplatin damage response ATP-dependent DNA ligase [Methylobacterium sp. WL116]TXN25192.1 cisplatin damage response ATP-dependent DNA ligase [Methylobacterium sp. WL93]TXN46614.1 cisplatin damage response ATP-dependent DNA ligase [Methylobacterium sp. WL119]TXN64614.1 cisplatin damage response ATP-dependent DNA ligase [Methylobacterium sp. WL30]